MFHLHACSPVLDHHPSVVEHELQVVFEWWEIIGIFREDIHHVLLTEEIRTKRDYLS